MVGYTISSPIFAQFGASFYPLKVMAVGLTIWAIAVTLCGLSTSFPILAFARALTGIGEASFLCLAPVSHPHLPHHSHSLILQLLLIKDQYVFPQLFHFLMK